MQEGAPRRSRQIRRYQTFGMRFREGKMALVRTMLQACGKMPTTRRSLDESRVRLGSVRLRTEFFSESRHQPRSYRGRLDQLTGNRWNQIDRPVRAVR